LALDLVVHWDLELVKSPLIPHKDSIGLNLCGVQCCIADTTLFHCNYIHSTTGRESICTRNFSHFYWSTKYWSSSSM